MSGESIRSAAPAQVRRSAHSRRRSVLEPAFFDRPTEEVARDLLGRTLVSTIGGARCAAQIVETEAYLGLNDEASHSHHRFGRTARNTVMYGEPGTTYVYRIYGMHWCMNAVTGPDGHPSAVLLRAAAPLEGLDRMRERRNGRGDDELLRGPGNLCAALGVTGELNYHRLQEPPLWIEWGDPAADDEVRRGPRIGISRAVEDPLRFWIRSSPAVSARRT